MGFGDCLQRIHAIQRPQEGARFSSEIIFTGRVREQRELALQTPRTLIQAPREFRCHRWNETSRSRSKAFSHFRQVRFTVTSYISNSKKIDHPRQTREGQRERLWCAKTHAERALFRKRKIYLKICPDLEAGLFHSNSTCPSDRILLPCGA
jgi:hypothetical protein